MTKEQFQKEFEEFYHWTSLRERPASVWYLSLETWAKMQFNQAYEVESDHD